jgi:hypothetical protein
MTWNDASRIRCKMALVCSQKWDDLALTERHNVRHCGQCESEVYLVHSRLAFEAKAAQGKCVSILAGPPTGEREVIVGQPRPPFWRRRPALLILAALAVGGAAAYLLLAG